MDDSAHYDSDGRLTEAGCEWIRQTVERLIADIRAEAERPSSPVSQRPAPRERIGPSAEYKELERLLGYPDPTGYRTRPKHEVIESVTPRPDHEGPDAEVQG